MGDRCVFCDRVEAHDYEMNYSNSAVAFEPLNPVTVGHMLFIPAWHCEHPNTEGIRVAMGWAEHYGRYRGEEFNLITSSGPAATQTIAHLHVHYLPRRDGDGLVLPWTGQTKDQPT